MDSDRKFAIRPLTARDQEWVSRVLAALWGEPRIISRGRESRIEELSGFAAEREDELLGLITHRIDGDECEVVSLNSFVENAGVGSALLATVEQTAQAAGCRRVWLITTNDNIRAIRFYQRRGWLLVAIHRNALDESRRLKPCIPEIGADDIPLRDEIEFECLL